MKFIETYKQLQESHDDLAWSVSKEYEASSKGIYDPENVRFREYHLNNNPRDGQVTVELNPNGYRLRNIFVDPKNQRNGLAASIYRELNFESHEKTGKPLRSSNFKRTSDDPTSLSDDGHKLWNFFVRIGLAVRRKDHYTFVDQ